MMIHQHCYMGIQRSGKWRIASLLEFSPNTVMHVHNWKASRFCPKWPAQLVECCGAAGNLGCIMTAKVRAVETHSECVV